VSDQQRPDRGHYGAGWGGPSQPAPGPGPAGGQQYGSGGGPVLGARPPRPPADPTSAFDPGASIGNTTGAAIAVVAVVLVQFLSGVVGLLGASAVVGPFRSYSGTSLVSSFVHGVFAAPSPFYVGAFLALTFLVPIARRSPLPVVLLRTVLAGAAGTIALALVGIVTGSASAVGGGAGRLLVDVVTTPLQLGLPLTLMLVATATAAWLWLGRPRRGAGRTGGQGRPGSVRPADAVPPATLPGAQSGAGHPGGPVPQAGPGQQPGAWPPSQPGQQAGPYGPYGQQPPPPVQRPWVDPSGR